MGRGGTGGALVEASWTTRHASASEQFGLWEQAVDEAFVPVTVRPVRSEGFVSSVGVRRFGSVDLAEIASPPQSVVRSAGQISQAQGDVYFLNLPLTSGAMVSQDARVAELAAGDFVLVDGDRPFELDFAAQFRQVSLKLPREVVHQHLLVPHEVLGTRMGGSGGLGALVSTVIRSAAETGGALDARSSHALGDRLVELIALAVGRSRPRAAEFDRRLLLLAALGEIDRSLADPDLSPAVVADRLGISVRHLHVLFAGHGPSFGRWLSARRLVRARAILLDPSRRDWTMTRIAHASGFADPAYFSRAFRIAYGQTPTALRSWPAPEGRRRGTPISSDRRSA